MKFRVNNDGWTQIGGKWYPPHHPCIPCFMEMKGDCHGCSTPGDWNGPKPKKVM